MAIVAGRHQAVLARPTGDDDTPNMEPFAIGSGGYEHGCGHEILVPRRPMGEFSGGIRDQIDRMIMLFHGLLAETLDRRRFLGNPAPGGC